MRVQRHTTTTEEEEGINITPMLDIVFIMLIFFVVTSSFVKESGVEVQRPSAQTSELQSHGNILVAIRANGDVWVDKRQVDPRAVRANVARLHAENPQGTVVLQADEQSDVGKLVLVMDQIRLAGIEEIAIAAALESP